jgi:uncharacterized protein YqeY
MLDQINDDIKVAMKAKEKEKLLALRYLKSMLMENSTSKKPSSDIDVIIKHHKKLKDSLVNFPADHPMVEQVNQEMTIISIYLPKQMSEEEVAQLIESIKAGLDKPNMGALMKELQPQIKGKFDGKKASDMVKAALN